MTEQPEQEQAAEGGELFVYWVPQEADTQRGNTRERLHGVLEVYEREAPGRGPGELLAVTNEGVAVFDQNHVRGWRTVGDVHVPDTLLSSDDSEDE